MLGPVASERLLMARRIVGLILCIGCRTPDFGSGIITFGGAVGTTCNPVTQSGGCAPGGKVVVHCGAQSGQWEITFACNAGTHCTMGAPTQGCWAYPADVASDAGTDATTGSDGGTVDSGSLVAGKSGEPCTPASQKVGCSVYDAPMRCDAATQKWTEDQGGECGIDAYTGVHMHCASGLCGGVPLVACVDDGKAFACP